uniref:SUN domain-containing protein n=1 Tax=Neogobius melanostomus TaxID=47308 RepID=A0A8C6UD38_9GOBI
MLNEDKILNNEKKILNEEQPILNEDKKILNEDQPILNEDKKILNEDQPILQGTIDAWKFFVVGKKESIYFNLPQPKVTTHLTLAHIAKVKSASGAIATAPRDFSLYVSTTCSMSLVQHHGMKDGKEHLLGRFTYDAGGTAVHQTFTVHGQEAYGTLRLAMESNWGDPPLVLVLRRPESEKVFPG